MSYILDALKRADAERERGAAPGLHTRHQVVTGSQAGSNTRRNIGLALAAGLVLLMLGLLFWVLPTPEQAPAAPAPMAPAAMTASNMTVPAPAPVPVPEAPLAKVTPMATPGTAKVAVSPASKTVTAATTTSAPASTPASVAPPALPAAAPLLGELAQELRGQIPKITITGSVYSDSPVQRLLLVNNLVLAQGGQLSPDLSLEEIQPRSSVFNFKGTRFRVMH